MFGLLNALKDIAVDTTKIVIAPIEVVAEITKAVVKPIAEVAEEVVDDIKESLDD